MVICENSEDSVKEVTDVHFDENSSRSQLQLSSSQLSSAHNENDTVSKIKSILNEKFLTNVCNTSITAMKNFTGFDANKHYSGHDLDHMFGTLKLFFVTELSNRMRDVLQANAQTLSNLADLQLPLNSSKTQLTLQPIDTQATSNLSDIQSNLDSPTIAQSPSNLNDVQLSSDLFEAQSPLNVSEFKLASNATSPDVTANRPDHQTETHQKDVSDIVNKSIDADKQDSPSNSSEVQSTSNPNVSNETTREPESIDSQIEIQTSAPNIENEIVDANKQIHLPSNSSKNPSPSKSFEAHLPSGSSECFSPLESSDVHSPSGSEYDSPLKSFNETSNEPKSLDNQTESHQEVIDSNYKYLPIDIDAFYMREHEDDEFDDEYDNDSTLTNLNRTLSEDKCSEEDEDLDTDQIDSQQQNGQNAESDTPNDDKSNDETQHQIRRNKMPCTSDEDRIHVPNIERELNALRNNGNFEDISSNEGELDIETSSKATCAKSAKTSSEKDSAEKEISSNADNNDVDDEPVNENVTEATFDDARQCIFNFCSRPANDNFEDLFELCIPEKALRINYEDSETDEDIAEKIESVKNLVKNRGNNNNSSTNETDKKKENLPAEKVDSVENLAENSNINSESENSPANKRDKEKENVPDENDENDVPLNEPDEVQQYTNTEAEVSDSENQNEESAMDYESDSSSEPGTSTTADRMNAKLNALCKSAEKLLSSPENGTSKSKMSTRKSTRTNSTEQENLTNSSEENNIKQRLQKKHKFVFETDDDSSNNSNEQLCVQRTKKRKRKRIVLKIHESTDEERDYDDDNYQSDSSFEPVNRSRKRIKKIMSPDRLLKETRDAERNERERRKRIEEKQKLYNKLETLEHSVHVDQVLLDFDKETKKVLVEVNQAFVRYLKPHQVEGIQFLFNCTIESVERLTKHNHSAGGILAHTMGLGKTFQVIAFLHTIMTNVHIKDIIRRVLIIVPMNVFQNWANEFDKWFDECGLQREIPVFSEYYHERNDERMKTLQAWEKEGGIFLCTTTLFNNFFKNKQMVKTFKSCFVDPGPDMVIIDEGHLLKNDQSLFNKNVWQIKTLRRVILTGTPLQNNLSEYYTMVSFVKPNLLGSKSEFQNRFENPIKNGQHIDSTDYDVYMMKKRVHILYKLLKDCIHRRDYNVLVPYLQPKYEYVLSLRLTDLQEKLYKYYLEHFAKRGKTYQKLFVDFTRLSLIWNHPALLKQHYQLKISANLQNASPGEESLYDSDSNSDNAEDSIFTSPLPGPSSAANKVVKEELGKTTTVIEISNPGAEGEDEDPECQIVFEKVQSTYSLERRKEHKEKTENPDVPVEEESTAELNDNKWVEKFMPEKVQSDLTLSAKFILLFDILEKCATIGDKLLIFSQSLATLDLIENFLKMKMEEFTKQMCFDETYDDLIERMGGVSHCWELGSDYFRIDGKVNSQVRSNISRHFNNPANHRARLLLVSTKAGGLGINLIGANRCVIFDASWNPANDMQAIFRIFRFGQVKPVYVYRFTASGTMESKIYERQILKQSLSHRVIDEQQVQRHFKATEANDLYKYQGPDECRHVPTIPKDNLLAEVYRKHKELILNCHEHDSLLENRPEEELTEEERLAAWNEYEHERENGLLPGQINPLGPPVGPSVPGVGGFQLNDGVKLRFQVDSVIQPNSANVSNRPVVSPPNKLTVNPQTFYPNSAKHQQTPSFQCNQQAVPQPNNSTLDPPTLSSTSSAQHPNQGTTLGNNQPSSRQQPVPLCPALSSRTFHYSSELSPQRAFSYGNQRSTLQHSRPVVIMPNSLLFPQQLKSSSLTPQRPVRHYRQKSAFSVSTSTSQTLVQHPQINNESNSNSIYKILPTLQRLKMPVSSLQNDLQFPKLKEESTEKLDLKKKFEKFLKFCTLENIKPANEKWSCTMNFNTILAFKDKNRAIFEEEFKSLIPFSEENVSYKRYKQDYLYGLIGQANIYIENMEFFRKKNLIHPDYEDFIKAYNVVRAIHAQFTRQFVEPNYTEPEPKTPSKNFHISHYKRRITVREQPKPKPKIAVRTPRRTLRAIKQTSQNEIIVISDEEDPKLKH